MQLFLNQELPSQNRLIFAEIIRKHCMDYSARLNSPPLIPCISLNLFNNADFFWFAVSLLDRD